MSYQHPHKHFKWEMPADPDLVAAIKMLAADDEDNAEACLDDAGSSREGDEFGALPPASAWMESEPRQIADARCSRCSEAEDRASILAGLDDALIDYADRIIYDDPIWTQLHAVRQALVETL